MAFLTIFEPVTADRAIIHEHVCPANRDFAACRSCPRVPGRARSRVPVSYPRCVVCSLNGRELRRGKRQAPSISDRASAGPTTRS